MNPFTRFNKKNRKKDMNQEHNNDSLGQEENLNPHDAEQAMNNDGENVSANSENGDEMAFEDVSPEGQKIAQLEKQVQETNDKYLRLVAEFDNFRKRNAKERLELQKTASESLMTSLLEVIDDSDRAVQQMENSDNVAQIKEGISLVFNKFKNILVAKGLTAMDAKGTDFDVEQHEAITEIPAPTPDLVGKVVDEVQKGYLLGDKIIRYAKVVVGK
jgi:molecular chaperone GrpE